MVQGKYSYTAVTTAAAAAATATATTATAAIFTLVGKLNDWLTPGVTSYNDLDFCPRT